MNLYNDCKLHRLDESFNLDKFDCGDADLNEFLQQDSLKFSSDLLGVSYVFSLNSNKNNIVCFFTVSNDGLNVKNIPTRARNKVSRKIPFPKRYIQNFPAVKIGRLGINKSFKRQGVGIQLMNFIKGWFIGNNKTGCRYILVDAYNKKKALDYY